MVFFSYKVLCQATFLEFEKHIQGRNKETTSICCCFVPERMVIRAVTHLAERNSKLLLDVTEQRGKGRATGPPLGGGGSIPGAAAAASRRRGALLYSPGCADLCWCFPEVRRFPVLAHFRASRIIIKQRCFSFTNPFRFFESVWSTMRRSDEFSFSCWRALRGRSTS